MAQLYPLKKNHPAPAAALLPERFSWAAPPVLALVLLVLMVLSLCMGAYPMSFGHAARIILYYLWPQNWFAASPWNLKELTAIGVIRPPRVLLATFAGVGLSLAGTALQGMMRNPLVGPDIVGVTAGAACGGAAALALDWPPVGVIFLAFCGGLLAMSCTYSLAKSMRARDSNLMLILSGVFIGAFFMALLGFIEYISPDSYIYSVTYWLIGSFVGADWVKVAVIAVPTLGGGVLLMALRWRLNLLSLGDLDARALGVNLGLVRWLVIGIVSLIVAAQVSVSGLVAWVGLVVPHCARMIVGPDHRRLLPTAAFLGGLFVLTLDDLTRTIVHAELPAGLLTALLGTPVVCVLLWKSRGKGWGRE
jgi:iron complex transport system permease protein